MALVMKGLNAMGTTANASGGAQGFVEMTIADAYNTAIPYGDPVTVASGYVTLCGESDTPIGILRGVRYVDSTGKIVRLRNYPASTTSTGTLTGAGLDNNGEIIALIEPVDNRKYLITTSDAAVSQASIGTTKRLKTVGTADAFGNSTAVVDMDATVSSETRLVRILGVFAHPDNALGTGTVVEVEFVEAIGDAT
jgi:hypothetical protein